MKLVKHFFDQQVDLIYYETDAVWELKVFITLAMIAITYNQFIASTSEIVIKKELKQTIRAYIQACRSTTVILTRTMSRSLVLFLVHFSFLWRVLLCNEFYVTTSTKFNNGLQCSVNMHCATLAQIAANSSAYLEPAENITLVLQQGHHQLDSEFMVSNVGGLLIISDNSTFDTPSINIKMAIFSNIGWLKISDVNFTQSGSVTVESVQNFFVVNSIFLESNGTALTFINTTASVVGSTFIFNSQGTYKGPFETITYRNEDVFAHVGGAMIVSKSNVMILSTLFEGNYAEFGGAVFSELNSQLLITKSNFTRNMAKI